MARGLNKPRARQRRVALLVLATVVLALHIGVTNHVAEGLIDFSAAQAMPARIEVAYVRELELAAPPAVAPQIVATAPLAMPPAIAPPAPAASSPDGAASAALAAKAAAAAKAAKAARDAKARALKPTPPEPLPEIAQQSASESQTELVPESSPEPVIAAAAEPASSASAPEPAVAAASSLPVDTASVAAEGVAAGASAASGAAVFDWPASTRVSYVLTGNYRGEVQGDAHVEWVRVGNRYQVHLDLIVGPSFAPLITRRMSSDGELGPSGLMPRRYDQDTKVVMRDRKRIAMSFDPDTVVLANGDRRDSVPGVQDTASQFVQLTYLFTTRPELLKVGGSFEVPLALPNRVDRWTYDVLAEETLHTSFGPLASFHLKPRRELTKPGDLRAEIWFAPQLRYLPVRIRIEQDTANFVDLMIARKPQLASP